VVHLVIEKRFGLTLCRSSYLNYLHRLGFVLKRPKKRLLKADAEAQGAFIIAYAGLRHRGSGNWRQDFLRR